MTVSQKSVAFLAALILSACGGGGGAGTSTSSATAGTGGTPTGNSPPTISGTPSASATVGQMYDFKPSATDANGNTLSFTVTNKPAWMTFNAQTGELDGTPAAGDVGSYSGISVTVSDGTATATLTAFNVTVNQIATGSATLNWGPPTQNSDGTTLSNLAGYVLRYGQSAGNLDQSITVTNSSLSTYVVSNLSPGTWYFSIVAVNTQGVQSMPTNVASVTL